GGTSSLVSGSVNGLYCVAGSNVSLASLANASFCPADTIRVDAPAADLLTDGDDVAMELSCVNPSSLVVAAASHDAAAKSPVASADSNSSNARGAADTRGLAPAGGPFGDVCMAGS